jgi:flagella basal body P-ring formation protein FlgA
MFKNGLVNMSIKFKSLKHNFLHVYQELKNVSFNFFNNKLNKKIQINKIHPKKNNKDTKYPKLNLSKRNKNLIKNRKFPWNK